MLAIYEIKGTLTGTIEPENVAAAQEYLKGPRDDQDMTPYLHMWEEWAIEAIPHLEWKLEGDGFNWSVRIYATRELTDDEQRVVSEWVSGQNSDGLGEGFEQQDFAEFNSSEQNEWGDYDEEDWHMCSFDWETNEHKLVRVK